MLRYIYTLFLGLILALFIGLGISTFYEGPKQPEYPIVSSTSGKEATDEQKQAEKDYEVAYRAYEKEYQPYSRNVSIVALISALILLVAGFLFEKRNPVIGGGVVLGGLFTMVYSIIRGFVSTDTKYTFVVVTVGVAIALYLGYRSFSHFTVRSSKTSKAVKG